MNFGQKFEISDHSVLATVLSFNTLNCISFTSRTHTIESFEIVINIQHCDKNHFNFLLKRTPQNRVDLLSEMHNFRAI